MTEDEDEDESIAADGGEEDEEVDDAIVTMTTEETPTTPEVTPTTPEATPTVAEVTPTDLRKRASKNLSNSDRNSILHSLLKNMKAGGNNKLCIGALKKAADSRFDIAPRTVSRIWKRYLQTVDSNGWGGDVSRRKRIVDGSKLIREY